MEDHSASIPHRTIGIDLGDRFSHLCILDREGVVIEEGRLQTTAAAFRERFEGIGVCRVALEVGTHSPWVSRILQECGHEVIVANPRMLKLVYGDLTKTDRVDAEKLARVARMDRSLLHPIRHRGAQAQADLAVLRSRALLVKMRTQMINHVRGALKSSGRRVSESSAPSFHKKAEEVIPDALKPALDPLLKQLALLTARIRSMDRKVEALAKDQYQETRFLRQVRGVGAITALCYVLTIEDPTRFQKSRTLGAYLGLRPGKRQSGGHDPAMRITKAGDRDLRSLLVGSAQYMLGPFGEDCDLKRFGQKLIDRGGKCAKKRAVVAVARKLAVLLHRLWISGDDYEQLRPARRAAAHRNAA